MPSVWLVFVGVPVHHSCLFSLLSHFSPSCLRYFSCGIPSENEIPDYLVDLHWKDMDKSKQEDQKTRSFYTADIAIVITQFII